MDEQERREAAVKRLKAKREFWQHLVVYVLVNALLIVVWWVTSNGDSHFWPLWPLLGWGIGLALHAWDTFRRPISEEAIRKEMEKGGA
ncbi:MAG: 2TM domain-containing protein [Acidimicrobiia bacterium]|nr:2TM domain-containing protein [Acidimicrobiia bacterium]